MRLLEGLASGGLNVLFAAVWSLLITGCCVSLFWSVRKWRGIKYSVGTDLFAVLLAADVSVYFEVVEIWRLSNGWSRNAMANASVILAVLTILTCWIAVEAEVSANRAYQRWTELSFRNAVDSNSNDREALKQEYISNLLHSWTSRWLIAAVHFWWIITRPRWAMLT
jgi:hypothetical protein